VLCPHCRQNFHDNTATVIDLHNDKTGEWAMIRRTCPVCGKMVLHLLFGKDKSYEGAGRLYRMNTVISAEQVYPRGSGRPPVPAEVPRAIAEDYVEACAVLADSPKASAALSRRCLQHILRETAGVKRDDLTNEIQEVLDSGRLPSAIADSIDAIRNIGNFSAHPQKSKSSGEILPVESHEAEWNLDVLETLFDFYYVQPAIVAKKRAALDEKLKQAGKPPMK